MVAKATADLAALTLLRQLRDQDRPATRDEQTMLARWSGWGAVPAIFDESTDQLAAQRAQLRTLLDDQQWRAAARTTLNAHYTDAAIAQAMWDLMIGHGFGADGAGRVLEPGCGAGTFLGLAPDSATQLVGVELDPTTAAIARHLYPHAIACDAGGAIDAAGQPWTIRAAEGRHSLLAWNLSGEAVIR